MKHFKKFRASSVTFDSTGQRLLMGAGDEQAHLWSGQEDRLDVIGLAGPGPVTFGPDGTPLQLAILGPDTLALYDVASAKRRCTFTVPGIGERDLWISQMHPLPLAALTPDGRRVAAAVRLSEDHGLVVVWEGDTGELLARFSHAASALAFTPDGALLAAGDDAGRTTLWSIESEDVVATVAAFHNRITCLAFQPNPRRQLLSKAPEIWRNPWLLAAGDSGGSVVVWDTEAALPVSFCRSAHHALMAVAFSPDGTRLAGGSHAEVRLWDVATGESLLQLNTPAPDVLQGVRGLAFSPDGQYLAICSEERYSPPTVAVFKLENGRGIQTLRGLKGEVSKVQFSPDDRYVAALSHGWQIGVWEVGENRLQRVIDAPTGFVVDNASLAISRDNRRLACSAGRQARLWEIDTGQCTASWGLPPGMQDELAFAPDGELYLLRCETRDGALPPSVADPRARLLACRVRSLKLNGTAEVVREVHDFTAHVPELMLAPDAGYFLASGRRADPTGAFHGATRAYDIASGKLLWARDVQGFGMSRHGPLGAVPADGGAALLFELPTGRLLGRCIATFTGGQRRMFLGGSRWISGEEFSSRSLYALGNDEPLVTLGIDRPTITTWPQFSFDETRIVWGDKDGSLRLVDLPAIRRRLAAYGLEW